MVIQCNYPIENRSTPKMKNMKMMEKTKRTQALSKKEHLHVVSKRILVKFFGGSLSLHSTYMAWYESYDQ